MEKNLIKPYQDAPGTKKEQVTDMFNRISGRYDFLNRFLSLGIDRNWRKVLVSKLSAFNPSLVLDVATGTADLAIAIAKANPQTKVHGMDIAAGMLEIGRSKTDKEGISSRVVLETGDAEALPYPDGMFDAATVAFGARNFEDLSKGIREMGRVLKPGGHIWVLEFSQPKGWFRPLFLLYFRYYLPLVGRLTSRDPHAYAYLFESVQAFPEGQSFLDILRSNGFERVEWTPLTFGTCSIYHGTRP